MTTQQIADDFAIGMRALVLVVFAILLLLAAFDLYWEVRRCHSLGHRFQAWARRYPLYSLVLLLLFGALVSHFFWQDIATP